MANNTEIYLMRVLGVVKSLEHDWPLTLQQVYDRLVAARVIRDRHNQYQKLSRMLSIAHQRGLVPRDAIEGVDNPDHQRTNKRSVQAAQKIKEAARERRLMGPSIPGYENATMRYHREQAERLDREAKKLLEVDAQREIAIGGEVLPIEADRTGMIGVGDPIGIARDTLKNPDSVAIDASTNRIDRLLEAGLLDTGIDAAHSIGAQNSLEKMLAHQMAACHHMAMKLSARAIDEDDTVEQTRLVNASARLMRTYQEGLLTFQKLRTGGKQTVVVQHVNITEGGQAVVAGKVGGGKSGG